MPFKVPAPPWYGTIFFQHRDGHGHSESYWMTAQTGDVAMTDLVQLATLRQAMFPPSCRVLFWRVSSAKPKRDTLVKLATAAVVGTYGNPQAPFSDVNTPSVALKLRVQHADFYWSYRLVRYIPEDCSTEGFWTPTPGMDAAMTALTSFLKTKCTGVFKPRLEEPPIPEPWVVKGITELIPLSITTRRTGRPFGQRRGRSVLR